MIAIVLMTSAMLACQSAPAPQVKKVEKAAPKAARVADSAEAVAKYNEMRDKTPSTAAAQWKLGLWCEEHGLKTEAYVHFAEVVRLDPKRDAAWRKLGFRKSGGHWMTDEQIAEDNEQKKADKVWGERLRKIHKDIHGANGAKKRDAAQAVLDAITDPRAIPSIYRAFGVGGPSHQRIAVQVLARINKPLSTKVLAMFAVYGKSPDVRHLATVLLRDRPATDFLDLLVGMMIDPLKYEVKPVGGPGTPGVLFVEGGKYNVSRFYSPPSMPNITPGPDDLISYDQLGMPIITRPLFSFGTPPGAPKVKGLVANRELFVQFSARDMMMEAQLGAAAAEAQLEGDVKLIKSINDARTSFNDRIMETARVATGKDLGTTPRQWREAIFPQERYAKKPQKPTLEELVPLAFNPVLAMRFVIDTRYTPDH